MMPRCIGSGVHAACHCRRLEADWQTGRPIDRLPVRHGWAAFRLRSIIASSTKRRSLWNLVYILIGDQGPSRRKEPEDVLDHRAWMEVCGSASFA